MEIFFFLKPIADLLFRYQVLDYFLTVLCIVFLIKSKTYVLCNIDYWVITLMGMFLISFLRNTNGGAILMKIESGFLLYFLGREYYPYWGKFSSNLQWGFFIVLLISIFAFISGSGFQSWGKYNTFTSFYYFKTDAAYAFSQCFIFFSIGFSTCRYNKLILILCILMTIFTNARAHYFIIFLLVILFYRYLKESRSKKAYLVINLKLFSTCLLLIIILLVIMNLLSMYMSENFLLFQFSNISDIMNGANTQGRSDIWNLIYNKFNNNDFFTKLIGIDLTSATAKVNGIEWSSHNMYIKILYSIGYLGIMTYSIFLFYVMHYLNQLRTRRLFYMTLALFVTFLISGLSCISIEDVQRSWLPMFYIGVIVSKVQAYK